MKPDKKYTAFDAARMDAKNGAVQLPTRYGNFSLSLIDPSSSDEHLVLYKCDKPDAIPLVRIHSECLTGDVFGSKRCDCGQQLDQCLKQVGASTHGYLFYLRQEGRGIGLRNKLKAYKLQESGLDTVDANQHLGFDADLRNYAPAVDYLCLRNITHVRLLTNNPKKVEALKSQGIKVERLEVLPIIQPHNRLYLETKTRRLGHLLSTERSDKSS